MQLEASYSEDFFQSRTTMAHTIFTDFFLYVAGISFFGKRYFFVNEFTTVRTGSS